MGESSDFRAALFHEQQEADDQRCADGQADPGILHKTCHDIAQEADGGVLLEETLGCVAQECGVKAAVLDALIRRVPDLRSQSAQHTLEVCGTCPAGVKLRAFIEKTYGVKGGTVSAAGFVYRVTPCMKNCKNGPSIRWDGKLHSHAYMALIRALIDGKR